MSELKKTRWQRITRLLVGVLWFASVMTVLGLAVRMTIRDRLPVFSILYYATPLMVLTFGGLFSTAGWLIRRRWKITVGFLIITLFSGYLTFDQCYVYRSREIKATNLRVLFWNPARGSVQGLRAAADAANNYQADLIGIVEGGARGRDDNNAAWDGALPDYNSSRLHAGLVILTKGTVNSSEMHILPGRGKVLIAEVVIHEQPLTVAVVDFDANVFLSRRAAIDELMNQLDQSAKLPDIIMGDFNTPGDSVAMDVLRDRYTNAFDTCGNGYKPTWPVPMPVLQLDHIWLGPKIWGAKCEAGWTTLSDHRPLILEAYLEHGNDD